MRGKSGRRQVPAYNLETDHWLPANPSYRRGWPGAKGKSFYRKTLYRIAIALAIFALLVMIRELPHPMGVQVREGLRYILTTEWNFQPVVQKVVQLGLQMVNVDHQFYADLPPGVREVMGGTALSEELLVPVSGKVVRGFGWSVDPLDQLERFHPGIDIACSAGTPVKAARSGQIIRVGKDPSLGHFLLLDHSGGTYTLYAGLDGALQVTERQQVDAGQVLGKIGADGDVPGGGLHFELREKNKLVDPLTRLQASGK